MTIEEFYALQVGDRIENHMSSSAGRVVSTTDVKGTRNVLLCWDGSLMSRTYSNVTTAWMHWTREDRAPSSPDGLQTP